MGVRVVGAGVACSVHRTYFLAHVLYILEKCASELLGNQPTAPINFLADCLQHFNWPT